MKATHSESNSAILVRAARLLGSLWTLPNTLLGVIVGLLHFSFPQRNFAVEAAIPSLSNSAHVPPLNIQLGPGIVSPVCALLKISAFTLGDCVLYRARPTPELVIHEYRHVQQYRVLGPLFLPLYFLMLAAFGYYEHPLERDARDYARRN